MLHGTHLHTIDRKCRLVIPADFVRALGPHCVLLPSGGERPSLLLVSQAQWEAWQATPPEPDLRTWLLCYVADAREVPVGAMSRIILPHELRCLLGLRAGDEVAVRGIGGAVEILRAGDWREERVSVRPRAVSLRRAVTASGTDSA